MWLITTEEADDPRIAGQAELWRRINPDGNWIKFDKNLGRWRPTSIAFRNSDDLRLSVYIAQIALHTGRTRETALGDYPAYGIAAFPAALARESGQSICFDPALEDGRVDFAHAHIVGTKPRSIRKKLAESPDLAMIVLPEGFGR